MLNHLSGRILLIVDNKAALSKAVDTSTHSGFPISLQIVKRLDKWLSSNASNSLEMRWFPGHCGLFHNELADKAANGHLIGAAPAPIFSIASRLNSYKKVATQEWHSLANPFLQQRPIRFKFKRKTAIPQLWGRPSRQFINSADNNIELFSRYTRLASGHVPIGSYCQKFLPDLNRACLCSHPFQDRRHLTTQCPLVNAKFPHFSSLYGKNNVPNCFSFLKDNPMVASFAGQPLDLDRPP